MKIRLAFAVGGYALALAACDNGETAQADTGDTEDAGQTSGDAGPMVVEVAANDTVIGVGGFVELTVVATHGSALEELVGGLVRVDTTALGPLVQVSNGVFSFTVSYDEVAALTGEPGGVITLQIELLDNAGESSTQAFELQVCGAGEAVCSPGECTDILTSPQTCGSCNNDCGDLECVEGYCDYDYYDTYDSSYGSSYGSYGSYGSSYGGDSGDYGDTDGYGTTGSYGDTGGDGTTGGGAGDEHDEPTPISALPIPTGSSWPHLDAAAFNLR